MSAICTFPNCGRPVQAAGLCRGHRAQKRRQIDYWIAAGEKPEVAAQMYRLEPLRGRHGRMIEGVKMDRVTISLHPTTARTVREDVAGARSTLDGWAKKKGDK